MTFRRIAISTALLFVTFIIHAQSDSGSLKKDKRINYFIDLQMGPLLGCNDCDKDKSINFSSAIIQGVEIGKKLRTGFGAGFDSYKDLQVLPFFGSVSWDLFGNKNTNALFIQLNYGGAKTWSNNSGHEYGFNHTSGGRMASALIGYRINYNNVRISFLAGLKSQRVNSYYEYQLYQFDGQRPPSTIIQVDDLNRIQFAVAIGWRKSSK